MIHALLIGGSPALRLHVLDAIEAVRPQSSCTVVAGVRAGRRLAAGGTTPGFDLVVLDLGLDDADAAVLLVDLHSAASVRPIIALPAADRRSDVFGALQLGAAGVLARDASADDTAHCLRTVLDGGVSLPPSLTRAPVAGDHALPGQRPVPGAAVSGSAELARLGLTARQTEVLARLLQGHANKEIARDLHLSVETIKDHVAAVLRGLGVHSRTQAVLAVERMLRDGGRPAPSAPTLQSAWRAVIAPRGAAVSPGLPGPQTSTLR